MKRLKESYKYAWTRRYKVDPQVAGEIFQRFDRDEEVVEAASDPKHPLHGDFDWNNSTAAASYRIWQARQMRCSLTVEVIDQDKKARQVRAFIRTMDRTSYVPTLESSPEELTSAEQQCWREMAKFKARWKGLQFAHDVIVAIDEKAQSVNRRVKRKHA